MEDQKQYFKGIVPPPIIFLLFLILGYSANRIMHIDSIFSSWTLRLLVGIPIFITAGLIAINASMVMIKSKTAINYNNPTTKFLSNGPFCFTRNPLYLSLLLAMAAIAVIANSMWYLIFLVIMFLIFNFGIVTREERYLTKCFGDEYTQYKNKVRRWI